MILKQNKLKLAVLGIVAVVVLSVMVVGIADTAEAQDSDPITVDADGSNADFETIQSAVDHAVPGQTIQVEPGTYNESVSLNKSVTLVGDANSESLGVGPSAPILDGEGEEKSAITIASNVSNITISGFIFENYSQTNLDYNEGNGIYAYNHSIENLTISNNQFEDLSGSAIVGGTGFHAPSQGESPTIDRMAIRNNVVKKTNQTAIYLVNSNNIAVENNKITGGENVFGDTSQNAIEILSRADSGNDGLVRNVKVTNNQIVGTFTGPWALVQVYAESHEPGTTANIESIEIADNEINPSEIVSRVKGLQIMSLNYHGDSKSYIDEIAIANNSISKVEVAVDIVAGLPNRGNFANSGFSNVSMTDNNIESTIGDSIQVLQFAEATYSNINIKDNIISNGSAGLDLQAYGEGEASSLHVEDNYVNNSEYGIFATTENEGEINDINIAKNTIENSSEEGMIFNTLDNSTQRNVTILNNTIHDAKGDGLEFGGFNHATLTNFQIAENTIDSTDLDGIAEYVSDNATIENIEIRNNLIRNGSAGITLSAFEYGQASLIYVEENQVKDSKYGIFARSNAQGEINDINIAKNTIENPSENSIDSHAGDNSSLQSVSISQNNIWGTTEYGGIHVTTSEYGEIDGTNIAENTVENSSERAIRSYAYGDSTQQNVAILNNNIRNSENYAIEFGGSNNANLTNVQIEENYVENGEVGVYTAMSDYVEIDEVNIAKNTIINSSDNAIYSYADYNSSLQNITISRNNIQHTGRYGIGFGGISNATLTNMQVVKNNIDSTEYDGILGYGMDNARIENVEMRANTITSSRAGIAQVSRDEAIFSDTLITENTVKGMKLSGVYIEDATNNGHLKSSSIIDNTLVENGESGIYVAKNTTASELTVRQNRVKNNEQYGIAHFGEGTLNATYNWWGDASGPSSPDPTHPVSDPKTGALANGSGDTVSSNVTFDPWLETSPEAPADVTGNGNRATDTDSDGIYEDLTGDKIVDARDVLALWNHRNELSPQYFDFTGDGSVDARDVLELWNQL